MTLHYYCLFIRLIRWNIYTWHCHNSLRTNGKIAWSISFSVIHSLHVEHLAGPLVDAPWRDNILQSYHLSPPPCPSGIPKVHQNPHHWLHYLLFSLKKKNWFTGHLMLSNNPSMRQCYKSIIEQNPWLLVCCIAQMQMANISCIFRTREQYHKATEITENCDWLQRHGELRKLFF